MYEFPSSITFVKSRTFQAACTRDTDLAGMKSSRISLKNMLGDIEAEKRMDF